MECLLEIFPKRPEISTLKCLRKGIEKYPQVKCFFVDFILIVQYWI